MKNFVTVHPFWIFPVLEKDTPLAPLKRGIQKSPLGRGFKGWVNFKE